MHVKFILITFNEHARSINTNTNLNINYIINTLFAFYCNKKNIYQ